MSFDNVLEVTGLVIRYPQRRRLFQQRGFVTAVHGVDLAVAPGRTLGLVGESGSGKSSIARAVVGLEKPSAGQILVAGRSLGNASKAQTLAFRRNVQMIFQDPYGSLDPRFKVGRIIAEPLSLDPRGESSRDRVAEMLETVGLRAADADRYPHEFSGGQRQRIAIARALVTRPALVVADEPVSALDISIQAQILNLMRSLQASHGVAYLFISHDLSVVEHLCDEVAVIHSGTIVERGAAKSVLRAPEHSYTRALKDAIPRIGRKLRKPPVWQHDQFIQK